MEYVGLGLHFEDLPVGRQFRTVGRTVTEADIVNFINCTGMTEVLFTDMDYLENHSDIRGRVAPGALVYSFAEGLLIQATMQHTGFAFLGMELEVMKPVFAGDTIHVECEVIEARLSKSRKNRSLVRTRCNVVKQDGAVAITYTPLLRQYRLSSGAAYQNFNHFEEVVGALSRVRGWPVAEGGALRKQDEYEAAIRMRLDTTQLPKPFQLNAVASNDWNLASDWYRWTVRP